MPEPATNISSNVITEARERSRCVWSASTTAVLSSPRDSGLNGGGPTIVTQATSALGITNYEVNPLGQRQRKTNSLGDTVFLYDTHGRLIAEFTSIGLLKREYIYLGEIPVAVILGNGQNFGPTADSYVDQNQPSANKGGESKLKVDPQKLRSYFKFDLTGIAGVITTAKLRLWGKSGSGQGSPVAAYSVADTNWGEMTITWANQPTAGATALSTTHVGSTQAWYEWDLTTYVSAEYAAGRPVVSFMLFGIPPGADEEFNSRQNLNNKPFLYVEPGTALYYIHVDHLNTPRLISNQQGQGVWRWDQQEPFGVTVPDENPSGLGAFEFPLRFPGQYFDKETNLHYNYFRDYDPQLGRYIQSDPIGLYGGINTYAYVGNVPTTLVDPSGECPWCVAGAVVGATLNIATQLSQNGGNWSAINVQQVGFAAASGLLGGGLGTLAAKLPFVLNVAANTFGSAAIGGGLAAASNALNSCEPQQAVAAAALKGGVFGGGGAFLGGTYNIAKAAWASTTYASLPLSTKLLLGSNAMSGPFFPPGPNWSVGGTVFGNVISNFVSNLNQ
jgi:RHS repeat-associated protein